MAGYRALFAAVVLGTSATSLSAIDCWYERECVTTRATMPDGNTYEQTHCEDVLQCDFTPPIPDCNDEWGLPCDSPGGGGGGGNTNPHDQNGDGKLDCWKSLVAFPSQQSLSANQDWGARFNNTDWHNGIDVAATRGTITYSHKRGWVSGLSGAEPDQFLGNYVRINYDDGTQGVYAHLESIAWGVMIFSTIEMGGFVGTVNCTGNCTGDHLHYTLWPDYNGPLNADGSRRWPWESVNLNSDLGACQ